MSVGLLFENVAIYCLQIAILVGVAALVPALLRLKLPGAKLVYLQLVLAACLLLPAIRGWKQEVVTETLLASTSEAIVLPPSNPVLFHVPWTQAVLGILGAGFLVRAAWLLTGFGRLRLYRRHSRALTPGSASISAWSAEADLRISDEVASPVTFGFLRPVVLLPARFPELDEPMREAILCHEVLHVRRRDWLFTIAEEMVRTVFWFHPAIWWLLGEIQLAREQAVDREVIEIMKFRDQYVDALLEIAGAPPRLDLAPAPLFLRKRHLKQRVFSILKEVRMSKTKSVSALAASVVMLAVSCWFVTGALPLSAAPQVVADSAGVAVETNGAQLMHRMPVAYPRDAAMKGIQGTVTAQVKLDGSGNVTDAVIVSGPEELRKTVLQSVLGWHFGEESGGGTRTVSITFVAPKGSEAQAAAPAPARAQALDALSKELDRTPAATSRTLRSITVNGLSDEARAALLSQLPVHPGDTVTPELRGALLKAVLSFDEHLTTNLMLFSPTEMVLSISPDTTPGIRVAPASGGPKIRVGGNVAQANLAQKIQPAYPPLAKASRIQGTVRFEATIGKDGHILNLQLVSGEPLLVQAAMEAVQQWVYKPTLLNGEPVEVLTTIDINFTLSQ